MLIAGCAGLHASNQSASPTAEDLTNETVPPVPVPPSLDTSSTPGCTTATWKDAKPFQLALNQDSGNLSTDHEVNPGLAYVAPREGLRMPNGTGIAWPHSIRTISSGPWEEHVVLFSFLHPLSIDITAASEEQARERGRAFLENVSLEDPANFDAWLQDLTIGGHSNEYTIYRAAVEGSFRLPEALVDREPVQDGLRSADVEAGNWRASLSLPLYRVTPEHGFIELSPLGEIQASLPPDPDFRSKANQVLVDFSLGTSSFQDFHEFDAFGRTNCADMIIS